MLPKLINLLPFVRSSANKDVAIASALDVPEIKAAATEIAVAAKKFGDLCGVLTSDKFLEGLAQAGDKGVRALTQSHVLSGVLTGQGRNGLDARFMKQNTVEITKLVQMMVDGLADRIVSEATKEINSEEGYKKWEEEETSSLEKDKKP